MNLTEQETLELTSLCNALVDGALTSAGRARLARILAGPEAAREFYVRFMSLSASLGHYAAEMRAETPAVVRPQQMAWRRGLWWGVGTLAAAAAAAIAIVFVPNFSSREPVVAAAELETQDFVAQATELKDCVWSDTGSAPAVGDQLAHGRRLELLQGVAEITFDCGAQVTLEGPATLDLNSAWDATLAQGTLSAVVPAEAIGFRVASPDVDVVDLGTEFSVVARPGSATEVYVHKGRVQTITHDKAGHEQPGLLLTADQSRQFNRGAVAEIRHAKPKFRMLAHHARRESVVNTPAVANMPSAAAAASAAPATKVTPPSSPVVSVPSAAKISPSPTQTPKAKRFANAMKFDGRVEKQVVALHLGHSAPRTVAFWVRVPSGAPLTSAGAMAAWSSGGGKGAPVHIAWNTDPAAGTLGALRTEYGHSAAVGSTVLRDGQWHHVAVVFVPHGKGKLHVKQYVDGRLEGSTTHSEPHRAHEKHKSPASDVVWLGRRLGSPEHFHGELDELTVTDRALAPQQIKDLLAAKPGNSSL